MKSDFRRIHREPSLFSPVVPHISIGRNPEPTSPKYLPSDRSASSTSTRSTVPGTNEQSLVFRWPPRPTRETGLVWNRSRTARKHAVEPRGSRPGRWIWGTYGPGIGRQLCRYVGTSGAATLRELDREFK